MKTILYVSDEKKYDLLHYLEGYLVPEQGIVVVMERFDSTFIDKVLDIFEEPNCFFVYDLVQKLSFAEGLNRAFKQFPGEGFIIQDFELPGSQVCPEADIFPIHREHLNTLGGFNEYLRSSYWVLEDYKLRASLAGIEVNDPNCFEQKKPPQGLIDKSAFKILWQIPGEDESLYKEYIKQNYEWKESYKENN